MAAGQAALDKALLVASLAGKCEDVQSLLGRHANVNAVDSDNRTPLHYASRRGHLSCVELLLDRQANVNAANNASNSPLHYAAANGHQFCVELLLDRQANVNAASSASETPLHYAARQGHRECVELLIDYDADRSSIDVRPASLRSREYRVTLTINGTSRFPCTWQQRGAVPEQVARTQELARLIRLRGILERWCHTLVAAGSSQVKCCRCTSLLS